MTNSGTEKLLAGTPESKTGAPAHILLFEDDDTLASLLARVLRNEGYHVDVFDSADAVPPPARLTRYDVVARVTFTSRTTRMGTMSCAAFVRRAGRRRSS